MEQKTEASQAVDERQAMMEALSMCIDALDLENGWQEREKARDNAAHVLGRAALKAQPAPTEAAQGAISTNPNLTTSGVTCQPVAAQGNTSNNSSSSQLSGNSGELANKQVLENIEQVQGEDSARLADECIKSIASGHGYYDEQESWHCASCNVDIGDGEEHKDVCLTIRAQEFLARASAETGGVKP